MTSQNSLALCPMLKASSIITICLLKLQSSNLQRLAVARSGFSYAMWVAQELKLPLGAYWPDLSDMFNTRDPERIVFVDDNILQGTTYKATKEYMAKYYPNVEWRWAVLFSDWHTPEQVRDQIIQGTRLPYFAEEPMWGSRKVSADYGVRYRDE